MYAIIGGVACQAAVQGVSKVNGADISPQVSTVNPMRVGQYCVALIRLNRNVVTCPLHELVLAGSLQRVLNDAGGFHFGG